MGKKFRHPTCGTVTIIHEHGDKAWILGKSGTNWVVDRSCLTEEPRVWDKEDAYNFLSDLSDSEKAMYFHIPLCTDKGEWVVYRITSGSNSVYRFDARNSKTSVREGTLVIKNGQLTIAHELE